ncbi:MAG: NAD(P)-dependent oxidoreductase [Acidimicrobiia bacterium]|nr:MAG: NAD(P)-dependent oxidoreductase [Acidimicrobiia bacterium]
MGELSIERDEVFRIKTVRRPGTLARALAVVGDHGAHIGEIVTVSVGAEFNIREVTVIAPDDATVERVHQALKELEGIEVLPGHVDKVYAQHEGGKIGIHSTATVRTLQDMREVYTPGVARVVQAIAKDESVADRLTWRGNTVAIVTNGTRVLGMGDVGPAAALPVMEGKALFYAELVDLNAVPIVLDAPDPGDVIETVVRLSPGFGGIHLEDIASPGVYGIEAELDRRLDIPVMHDDQQGTAVVVMAAVLTSARRLGKETSDLSFGQLGLGAAGSAIAGLASSFGFAVIRGFDPSPGGVERLLQIAEPGISVQADSDGAFQDEIIDHSDVLVMTTGVPGLLPRERCHPGQIIMALTNPVPEITASEARAGGAALAADGSIVNNVLAYPGLFRGALDAGAGSITTAMKRAAAFAIADATPADQMLPNPLDREVHLGVAEAVAKAASG